MEGDNDNLKSQFKALQEQQQKKLQRRKERQEQKQKEKTITINEPPAFGIDDALELKVYFNFS